MNEDDEFYCPILKNSCIGKECACAVKIDNPFDSPYLYHYVCGLVNVCDHSIPTCIGVEMRIDDYE